MARKKKDRREIFKALKSGEVAPLYFLHGPDVFMLETAVEAVLKAALPGGPNDFNFEKYRGNDASADVIRNAAETLPFMTERRVVLIHDAQEMPAQELEALTEYFENPAPTTCMVVVAMTAAKKLDGRTKTVQTLRKNAEEFEFAELREYEVGDVLKRNARSLGLNLAPDAAAYLVEALGTDMATLMGALEKVDLYLGRDNRNATFEEVQAIIADTRVRSVFELADAIGGKELGVALRILDRMLGAGESAVGTTAMIARHFRIVGKLQDPEVRRMSDRDAAKVASVPPFFLGDYKSDAGRFSAAEVAHIRRRLTETDFALKSSRLSDRTILEGLILDVCSRDVTT